MARKREILVDQDEDIVAYEHHRGAKFVRVQVGMGSKLPDGTFIEAESQNYENFIIQGEVYELLMAESGSKPKGVFRVDDLWDYVDAGRHKVLAEREKIKQDVLAAEEAKNAEPTNPKK